MCVKIKSAVGVSFPKVEAEVVAPSIPCLPVKEIKVPLGVEVTKGMQDAFVVEVLVVCREVFCW